MPYSRRRFVATALGAVGGAALPACRRAAGSDPEHSRLTARPVAPRNPAAPGLTRLGGTQRDGLLFVPASYRPDAAAPLVVALHGAGGDADGPIGFLTGYAEDAGVVLLATGSRQRTWDAVLGSYGEDVTVLDRSLRAAFARCAIDPARVFIEGFSDGATYALGLGIANGDLFRGIVAFSPGFLPDDGARVGEPRVFISHGTEDSILPIGRTSRRLVPALRNAGYDVTYREFTGGHDVPDDIARAALAWMLAP